MAELFGLDEEEDLFEDENEETSLLNDNDYQLIGCFIHINLMHCK